MNRGLLRGLGQERFLPDWLGSNDPARAGTVPVVDLGAPGGLRLSSAPFGWVSILDYGADPTGTFDSGPAILAAAAASLPRGIGRGTGTRLTGLYIPFGTYTSTSQYVDLSPILGTTGIVNGWQIYAEPGAVFKSFGLKIQPGQLLTGTFRLPKMDGTGAPANTDLLTLTNFVDCDIWVPYVYNAPRDGVVVDQTTFTQGYFNNRVWLGLIQNNGQDGISVKGNTSGTGYDCQGNTFWVNDAIGNTRHGINYATAGVTSDTAWNRWNVNVCENNGGAGINDQFGRAFWNVNNTNNNASKGYVLVASAAQAPVVIGAFSDGYTLNSTARLIDMESGISGFEAAAHVDASSTVNNGSPTVFADGLGPAVSIRTGTAAVVSLGAEITVTGAAGYGGIWVVVSGATTIAANNSTRVLLYFPTDALGSYTNASKRVHISGLTPGLNTFTMVGSGQTLTAQYRHITAASV